MYHLPGLMISVVLSYFSGSPHLCPRRVSRRLLRYQGAL